MKKQIIIPVLFLIILSSCCFDNVKDNKERIYTAEELNDIAEIEYSRANIKNPDDFENGEKIFLQDEIINIEYGKSYNQTAIAFIDAFEYIFSEESSFNYSEYLGEGFVVFLNENNDSLKPGDRIKIEFEIEKREYDAWDGHHSYAYFSMIISRDQIIKII